MINNSWEEWSIHVLKELERLNIQVDENRKTLNKIDTRLVIIETKALMIAVFTSLILSVAINVALAFMK